MTLSTYILPSSADQLVIKSELKMVRRRASFMMTRSGCSVAGAFSSTVGATPLTTDVSGTGCSSATSGSGFANNVQIQAPINVKSGYPSEIKAPTPTNAIKAMNQTFVRADSHAPKIDEYLSWKMAVMPAATRPKTNNTMPNTFAHIGNLHWS